MARIIYSGLVESIRGSIAGTTFQGNAYGYTIKSKPSMVRPNRPVQIQRQQYLSKCVNLWKTLSTSEKDSWNSYAQSFPVPSRLNPGSNLNGYNYFMRYHSWLQLVNPNDVLADAGTNNRSILHIGTLLVRSAGPDSLQFDVEFESLTDNFYLLIFLTSPLSSSQQSIRKTSRYMGFDEEVGGFNGVITQGYIDRFGRLPEVGETVGIKMVLLNTTSGQMSLLPAEEIIVTAP